MPLPRSLSSDSQLDPTSSCVRKPRGDHQRSAESGTSGRGPSPWWISSAYADRRAAGRAREPRSGSGCPDGALLAQDSSSRAQPRTRTAGRSPLRLPRRGRKRMLAFTSTVWSVAAGGSASCFEIDRAEAATELGGEPLGELAPRALALRSLRTPPTRAGRCRRAPCAAISSPLKKPASPRPSARRSRSGTRSDGVRRRSSPRPSLRAGALSFFCLAKRPFACFSRPAWCPS